MKIVEYGVMLEYEGIYWSKLALDNDNLFRNMKAGWLCEYRHYPDVYDCLDDENACNGNTIMNRIKKSESIDDLLNIRDAFIERREASE